ncbi:hypothetical protein BS78_10G182200 [Paspalum vaginatum]|nr:hypothetical protein BS78_10G182200 [Paspalum vaginatum]
MWQSEATRLELPPTRPPPLRTQRALLRVACLDPLPWPPCFRPKTGEHPLGPWSLTARQGRSCSSGSVVLMVNQKGVVCL